MWYNVGVVIRVPCEEEDSVKRRLSDRELQSDYVDVDDPGLMQSPTLTGEPSDFALNLKTELGAATTAMGERKGSFFL